MEGMKELVEYGVIGLLIGLSLWAVAVATIMIGGLRIERAAPR